MLIVPASYVSVPFTVVNLSCVRTSDRVLDAAIWITRDASLLAKVPLVTHTLPVIFITIRFPCHTFVAAWVPSSGTPVLAAVAVPAVVVKARAVPEYPVASYPPESPNWMMGTDVPLVETAVNEMRIVLTQLGMPVNSTLAPVAVLATGSVNELPPHTGVLIVGLVSVLFVSVSVVALPTNVSVDVGSVSVPVFEIVEITGEVRVLLVSV